MTDYSASREARVTADTAYALLADWGNTAWMRGPERTEVQHHDGRISRYLYMPGTAPVVETLLSADPLTRTLQYTIAPGELFTLRDYQGTVVVTPTPAGCSIVWSCAFALGEMTPEDAQAIAQRNLTFLLVSVCAHLEA